MALRSAVQRIAKATHREIRSTNCKSGFGLHLCRSFSSTLPKVLIPTNLNDIAEEILKKNQFEVISDGNKAMDLIDEHPDANYLIVRSEEIDESVLKKMKDLKLVVRAGAGYNTIDTKYARKLGVDVMNTPGANANGVAEEVIGMILAVFRHLAPADASTRDGKWEKSKFMGHELHKKTVAIAGLGSIGRLVAKRLSGFECRLLGFDPLISGKKAKELNIELVHTLDELVREADVLSLHIPENDNTRGIINEDILMNMKDGSCIINAARAGIIDENALRKVKKKKGIKYCTDVYPKDVAGLKPVADIADLMLPHIGANTHEANKNAALRAAQQIVEYRMGVCKYVVNRNIPEGLDQMDQKLAFYISKICTAFGNAEGKTHPETIKTFFYGDLQQYSDYLTAPIVMGLGVEDFDPSWSKENAKDYLQSRGIELTNSRQVHDKEFGNAITVEMTYGNRANATRLSLRGKVTDGIPMVSRMDQFNGLYFDMRGHNTFIKYSDKPGMLAEISNIVARHDVNIEDIRCPHDKASGCSLAVIRTNIPIGETCLKQLQDCKGVTKAAYTSVSFPKKE